MASLPRSLPGISAPAMLPRKSLLLCVPGEYDIDAGRLVRQRAADVFDGAADGVLAVERALRSAQHFDARDVVDVEQRALRPGDVDVVDVEADAGIDAPQRIGLADAAHERGERRRLVASLIDRQVRHLRLQLGDVGRRPPLRACRR